MSGSSTQQEPSETNVLEQLIENNGENPLMQKVLDIMAAKLDEARSQYFRKPVTSVPYGASIDHSQTIAKRHPELREITYQATEASPAAIFEVTKHLAVRRTLLQLVASDSGLVEDPFAQQILTSGINMSHHMFVWRTSIPICNLDAEPIIQATKFYMVVDTCESKVPITQVFKRMENAYAAEAMIISPYDPRMWTVIGGHNSEADYVFQWMDPRALPSRDVVKPANLPSRFFSDAKYKGWSLYIQPAGSMEATVFTRQEFVQLYGGVGLKAFHEMRTMRNGFADISVINAYNLTDYVPTSLSEAFARVMSSQSVAMGMVEIPRFSDSDLTGMIRLGRQYDLHSVYPCVVRQSLADNAQRKFFTTRPGRDLIAALLQTLHATSARFVYNGAIITVDQLVDVETLCVLLEYVIRSNISSKLKLTAVTGLAKTPHAARSSDYVKAIVSWASNKVIERAEITQDPKEMARYVASLLNKGVPLPFREVQADEGLQFGEPQPLHESENDEILASIVEYAQDSLGDPFDLPYKVQREELDVDKLNVMAIRQAMMKMDIPEVSIHTVQDVYDHIAVFAGNSMVFPTMNQVEMEKSDFKFTIDVQYFRASIPALFSCTPETKAIPSMLRTSVGTDLSTSSFRQLLLSLMKRNFNRPRPEAPGSRLKSVIEKVATAITMHGHARAKHLMPWYRKNPITVSGDVLNMWASQHTRSEVLAAATMLSQEELMPDQYRVMTKDVPKPTMDLSAQGELAVGQTIVFHGKDVIALTAGAFNLYLTRVISLFDTNIRFAFGPDEHTSGDWADSYLDIPGTVVTEIDVPKFDKSQDWMCFELILHMMERIGMDPALVKLWRKASDGATVFNALFHLTFTTMFGNRSGNAGTLGTNCIVLLFAYLSTFASAGIVAILIKGDDSVLVTKRSLSHEEHVVRLLQDWGFSMKIRERKGNVTSFCSSFFVKDSDDKYRLVRDPCRVITKLGRALSLTKPASYFLDYYVAVFDTAVSYDDDVVVHNLTNAVCIFYGCEIDVVTFVNFLKYVSFSSERFLSVVYGLTADQITNINDFDDAEETLIRTKSQKFTKAKHLADKHSVVKTSLQTQIRLSCDWIFD